MNPSASEWRPGFAAPPPPQIVSDPPPSSNNNANANDSEIDESDPLWNARIGDEIDWGRDISIILFFALINKIAIKSQTKLFYDFTPPSCVVSAPTFFMHPLYFKYTNNTSLDHERFFIATKS